MFTKLCKPAPGGMSSLVLLEDKNEEKVKKICIPMTRSKTPFKNLKNLILNVLLGDCFVKYLQIF